MKTRFLILSLLLLGAYPASLALAAHAPLPPLASHNWAGYVAMDPAGAPKPGQYSAINGSWKVPTIVSSSTPTSDALWIGIGGMQGNDLIQTGVRSHSAGGTVSYTAWYELLPAPAISLPMEIRNGDTITASLQEVTSSEWLIALTDATTGEHFSTLVSYHSSLSSAEWIVEAPGTGSKLLPLDAFGSIRFFDTSASAHGAVENLAALGAQGLTLEDMNGTPLATPTALTGSGFSVFRD